MAGRRTEWIGVGAVLVIAVAMLVSFSQVIPDLFTPDRRTVRAAFTDPRQLKTGDAVRIDGVEVGEVTGLELGADRRSALVTMEVDEDAGGLYADARAAVAARTLLGGVFIVDLRRGTPGAGPLRFTIPARRTSTQVELEDVTSVVRGGAREGLRTIPHEASRSLRDPDRLPAALAAADAAAPDLRLGLRPLRGVAQDRDLDRVVRAGARVTTLLAARRADLQRLVSGAGGTFGALAAEQVALDRTLGAAPAAMRELQGTLVRLRPTLAGADGLLDDLEPAADDVAPALRDLRPVLGDARGLLADARPVADALRPAAVRLRQAARDGAPLVRGLTPALEAIDRKVLPFMAEVDKDTERPAYQMVGPALSVLGTGGMGQLDANGHFFRFPAFVSEGSLGSSPCRTFLSDPDREELATCDALAQTIEDVLTYSPVPAKGSKP